MRKNVFIWENKSFFSVKESVETLQIWSFMCVFVCFISSMCLCGVPVGALVSSHKPYVNC